MSEEQNKDVIRQAIDAMNRGDPAAVGKLVAPGFVRHDLARMVADVRGGEGVTDFLRMLQSAAPDLVMRIEDIFATGDRVALRLTMEGTHQGELLGVAPTGKRIEIGGINIYRFEDGKIAETWQLTDWAGMLRQVGAGEK